MKREYTKPFLAVESFQLDAAIAGDCTGKYTLNYSVDTCTLEDEKGSQLTNGYFGASCGIDVVKPDTCYHAMSLGVAYIIS